MGIGTRLEELIKLKETNANELAMKIDVAPSTIYSMIKRDSNRVDIDIIIKIAHALGMTADEFLSEEFSPDQFTIEERTFIEKYRKLDKYGTQAVDTVLDVEYTRCTDLDFHVRDNVRTINYYLTPASAGPGQILFDDVDVEQISIPDDPEYKRVAYAVGVRGDSMEPAFFDDDILLVEPGPDIRVGEIGIFYVDGQSYIKELGHGELISLNPAYGPIPLNEESRCMGRVVGKL